MAPKAAMTRVWRMMDHGAAAPSAAAASSPDTESAPPIPMAGSPCSGQCDNFDDQQLTEFYMLVTWRDAAGWQGILSYTHASFPVNLSREWARDAASIVGTLVVETKSGGMMDRVLNR